MVLNCPHCGKSVQDEDAVYCPYCSKPIKETPYKKTGFPIAGGVLIIIAACICFFLGILVLASAIRFTYSYTHEEYLWLLIIGIFGILGFALGLAGGIMALLRKGFILAVVGSSFVLLSGFVTILGGLATGHYDIIANLLFEAPSIILSALALIFLAVSKQEFD